MKENNFLKKIALPFLNSVVNDIMDVFGEDNFYKLFKSGLAYYLKGYNFKVCGCELNNIKKPLLIVANHDDIFSGLYLAHSINQRVYAAISMSAEPTWYKLPFKEIIERYTFIVENGDLKESLIGLNNAINFLEKGKNILIFANGPGHVDGIFTRNSPYKKGAAYISKKAISQGIDFKVIPAFIRTGEYLDEKTGVGSDKNVTICFGEPLIINPESKLDDITEDFKKNIGLLEKIAFS
jgi:1-acyl-sn-glycerol-3-phosphate acyltransferase